MGGTNCTGVGWLTAQLPTPDARAYRWPVADEPTLIYVALLDEGVDVWRPVAARHLHRDVYLIADQAYDRETETWQFEPGDRVRCRSMELSDGTALAQSVFLGE